LLSNVVTPINFGIRRIVASFFLLARRIHLGPTVKLKMSPNVAFMLNCEIFNAVKSIAQKTAKLKWHENFMQ